MMPVLCIFLVRKFPFVLQVFCCPTFKPVADPGFPQGGGTNSAGGGLLAPTYDFAKFSQKLHEIERIWTPGRRGARPKFYYVDPPLQTNEQ